jgi:putative flippase GtrA
MHNQQSEKEGIYFYAVQTGRKLLEIDFVRFSMVGAVGFIVNLSVLFVLYDVLKLPIWVAQLLAVEVALISNFTLHHFWTFRHRSGGKRKRLLLAQFHLSSWSGAIINSSIVVVAVDVFNLHYFFGLVFGSATALFWNFFWTKFYIWHHAAHGEKKSETTDRE